MSLKLVSLIFFLWALRMNVRSLPMEPVCSKFDYEYKTLEAMLRMERHVEDMKKEMEKIQDEVTKKLQEIEELKETQERELSTMRRGLEDKSVAAPMSKDDLDVPTIAFSVGNPTRSTNNGVLLFKTVTSNRGGAYDVQTGVFTCPKDGIYLFVLTIATTRSNTESWCMLQLNKKNVMISRSYDTMYTTASNTAILELKKDDVVAPGNCYKINDLYVDHSSSSFSGVFISRV